jgi:hypothetical protein
MMQNQTLNQTTHLPKSPKKSLYLKLGGFKGGIVWSIDCFVHKQIEIGKVMNLSTLNPGS